MDTGSVNTLSWSLAAFLLEPVSWRLSVVELLKLLQVQLLISGPVQRPEPHWSLSQLLTTGRHPDVELLLWAKCFAAWSTQ